MKKAINLSGAEINAGDYLIEYGANQILSGIDGLEYLGSWSRHSQADAVKEDIIQFIFGGPMWSSDVFDTRIPHASLKAIPMGVGCLAALDYEKAKLGRRTALVLENLKDAPVTTRDFATLDFLRERGVKKAVLGGCPAFLATYPFDSNISENHFIISDPSWWWNYSHSVKLISSIKRFKPNAKITFLWHRGIIRKTASLKLNALRVAVNTYLSYMGVRSIDGANKLDIFKTYLTGIHIGFRVHAHVFCRSNNVPSVLLCEDHRSREMVKVFQDQQNDVSDYNFRDILKELDTQRDLRSLKIELKEQTLAAIRSIVK